MYITYAIQHTAGGIIIMLYIIGVLSLFFDISWSVDSSYY